jgi:hypothetical protein
MNSDHAERRALRVLHLHSDRYVLAPRGSDVAGEHLDFADRERARLFLASLAREPGNEEVLRAAVERLRGVPSAFGGRPDEGEWGPLSEALARHSIEAVRLVVHPVSPVEITTTGKLTLSEVSWGETSSIYPSSEHMLKPDKWDPAKLDDLLEARGALTDVATRNHHVRRAKPGQGYVDQLMRPYHCMENFPQRPREIDEHVNWFYLSALPNAPISHPGTSGTSIVKTYGPFHNAGGGDADPGPIYLHFYKLG